MTNSAPSPRPDAIPDTGRSLFRALLDARRRYGGRVPIAEDVGRKPLSYLRLVLGAVVLGRRLAAVSKPGEHLGVMLPNSNGALLTILGLLAFGRVPAMLNASAGANSMLSACTAAGIRTVLSSRRFVAQAKLEAAVGCMAGSVRIVLLEDLGIGGGIMARTPRTA